jgi:hypothetical protein
VDHTVVTARRLLVLAIEDAQWAGEALLDFLESLVDPEVAARADPATLVVVMTARPELAERHPGWGWRARASAAWSGWSRWTRRYRRAARGRA